ncbi:hypothetical protein [Bradyrhizobium sp.]
MAPNAHQVHVRNQDSRLGNGGETPTYCQYRAAVRAEDRRELCFTFGMPLAMICMAVASVDAALLAFGCGSWWLLAAMLVGLLVARQMMTPGVNQDGLGYRLRPMCRRVLRLLRLRGC